MTTDYRALCAALLNEIGHESPTTCLARAALAQPEPVELPLRVGHILRLAEIIREVDGNHDKGAAALAEAILDHPGSRWQSREAQPEPVGPTDDQIDALVICIQALPIPDADDLALSSIDRGREMVRQALARWGHPTLTPIPVSEKMPSAEAGDLDSNGMCWCNGKCGGYDSDPTDRSLWSLSRISDENEYCEEGPPSCTHWLPHWALPFPARSDHH